MALEGADDRFRLGPVKAGDVQAIAVDGEHGLQRFDLDPLRAALQTRAVFERAGRDVMADPRLGQGFPRKIFAGIDLAVGRNVRMRQHPLRRDPPARDNILAEPDDGFDLRRRIGGRAAPVPRIGDFNPDRDIVHVSLAGPIAAAGVPGAARLRHELQQAAILQHEIMRRHFRDRVAKLPQGGLSGRQASVMQDDRVRRPPFAFAVVRRGMKRRGKRTIWFQ